METTRKPNAPAIFLTSIRLYAILSEQVWDQCPIVGSAQRFFLPLKLYLQKGPFIILWNP